MQLAIQAVKVPEHHYQRYRSAQLRKNPYLASTHLYPAPSMATATTNPTRTCYLMPLMPLMPRILLPLSSPDCPPLAIGFRHGKHPPPVSYTHLRAHETDSYLVCRLLLEKKKKKK